MKVKINWLIICTLCIAMIITACGGQAANNDHNDHVSGHSDEDVQLAFANGTIIYINEEGNRVLVTEYKEQQESRSIRAIYLAVMDDTELLDANSHPVQISDLHVGQQVKAWTSGAIAESYPEQGKAARIQLLSTDSESDTSRAQAIERAIDNIQSSMALAVRQVQFDEQEGQWTVELVDAMYIHRTMTFKVDEASGDVTRIPVADNEAFRIFTPEPQEEVASTFTITGEARVFEATFQWMLEDGHNILAEGTMMAEQGAPEWGKFEFEVSYEKASSPMLSLIFHVESAKDGEVEHQLIVPLKVPEELIERHG